MALISPESRFPQSNQLPSAPIAHQRDLVLRRQPGLQHPLHLREPPPPCLSLAPPTSAPSHSFFAPDRVRGGGAQQPDVEKQKQYGGGARWRRALPQIVRRRGVLAGACRGQRRSVRRSAGEEKSQSHRRWRSPVAPSPSMVRRPGHPINRSAPVHPRPRSRRCILPIPCLEPAGAALESTASSSPERPLPPLPLPISQGSSRRSTWSVQLRLSGWRAASRRSPCWPGSSGSRSGRPQLGNFLPAEPRTDSTRVARPARKPPLVSKLLSVEEVSARALQQLARLLGASAPTRTKSLFVRMSNSRSTQQVLGEGVDEVTRLTNRKSRKRSRVWDFFKELPDEGKAICVYCETKLAYHPKIGVSHFKRHILSGCQEFPEDVDRNAIFPVSEPVGDGSGFVVDPAVTRDLMNKFWISANIAFRKVENGFFKKMMKSAHPSLQVHGRKTLKKDRVSVYEEEKKIANSLANSGSHVSFTTDMWTSVQELGYICLTAHYIDEEFNLHMQKLSFKSVPYPHNAATIHNTIMDCLYDWDLPNKAFSFTLDNATSNTAAVNKLKAKLWIDMPFGGEDLHVRCAAHILNLVVQDGMDIIKGAIDPVRDVVKHVNSSGPRLQTFNLLPEMSGHKPKKGLTLDVPTRWNSTYAMLEEALEFKAALTSYAVVQNIQGPTVEEWSLAEIVCNLLKNFSDATKVFSMYKFPTAHRYLSEIWGIRELLVDEKYTKDDFLKELCEDIKAKFDKYWDQPNKVLLVASLLDPRYKLVLLKFCCTEAYGEDVAEQRVAVVRNWFKEYYEYYERMVQNSSNITNINSSPEVGGLASMLPTLIGKRKLELGFALFKQRHRPNRSRRLEVDIYLEDPLVPLREGECFDVLKWWKRNAEQYLVLAKMARDFLAIPLSSVASESTFSTAGMIIDTHRTSLNPETAEGLICSKDWLLQYLSDEEEDSDDD